MLFLSMPKRDWLFLQRMRVFIFSQGAYITGMWDTGCLHSMSCDKCYITTVLGNWVSSGQVVFGSYWDRSYPPRNPKYPNFCVRVWCRKFSGFCTLYLGCITLNDAPSVLEKNFCHSHCHQKRWGNVDIVNRQHVVWKTCKILGIQAVKKMYKLFWIMIQTVRTCSIKSDNIDVLLCKVL